MMDGYLLSYQALYTQVSILIYLSICFTRKPRVTVPKGSWYQIMVLPAGALTSKLIF